MERCLNCNDPCQEAQLFLRCTVCRRVIHTDCVQVELPGAFVGDDFFLYWCDRCNSTPGEGVQSNKWSWLTVTILTLHNLRALSDNFDAFYDEDAIREFVIDHWEEFWGVEFLKQNNPVWPMRICEVLEAHQGTLFQREDPVIQYRHKFKLRHFELPKTIIQNHRINADSSRWLDGFPDNTMPVEQIRELMLHNIGDDDVDITMLCPYNEDPTLSGICHYCSRPGNAWTSLTVRCVGECGSFIHLKCLRDKTPGKLLDDYFFYVRCTRCVPHRGNEEFIRFPLSWVSIMIIILHNLRSQLKETECGQDFFDIGEEILPFIHLNKAVLFTESTEAPASEWLPEIINCLQAYEHTLFECGNEQIGEPNSWRLIPRSRPLASMIEHCVRVKSRPAPRQQNPGEHLDPEGRDETSDVDVESVEDPE